MPWKLIFVSSSRPQNIIFLHSSRVMSQPSRQAKWFTQYPVPESSSVARAGSWNRGHLTSQLTFFFFLWSYKQNFFNHSSQIPNWYWCFLQYVRLEWFNTKQYLSQLLQPIETLLRALRFKQWRAAQMFLFFFLFLITGTTSFWFKNACYPQNIPRLALGHVRFSVKHNASEQLATVFVSWFQPKK